nr:retrovirus-related Pol polyprotein from transposon TNT 1-94 [Tanacetum cinerariifolium]
MDINSSFLNGKLKEKYYVKQPPGLESSEFSNHVCKLDKLLIELNKLQEHVKTPMVPPNKLRPDLNGKAVNETQYRGFDLKGYSDSDYAGCNMDRKCTSGVNTFRNAIGAHYLPYSSEYVTPPFIDIVRPWFETIKYGETFPAKGTLKKSLLPPRWRWDIFQGNTEVLGTKKAGQGINTVNVDDTSSKAMVAIDRAGFYWIYMADDDAPTNMALMDFSDSE